jgi:hypothetical protein
MKSEQRVVIRFLLKEKANADDIHSSALMMLTGLEVSDTDVSSGTKPRRCPWGSEVASPANWSYRYHNEASIGDSHRKTEEIPFKSWITIIQFEIVEFLRILLSFGIEIATFRGIVAVPASFDEVEVFQISLARDWVWHAGVFRRGMWSIEMVCALLSNVTRMIQCRILIRASEAGSISGTSARIRSPPANFLIM